MKPVVGLFVGGRSARMGGHPKGLLASLDTGEALAVRIARIAASLPADLALVGDAKAYRAHLPDVPAVADEPAGIGPLGGLAGLLAAYPDRTVIALACDMPFVTAEHLVALLAAHPAAPCVCARAADGTRWEPFFSRWNATPALPTVRAVIDGGGRSLQRAVDAMGARELTLDAMALADWDTPDDVRRCRTP